MKKAFTLVELLVTIILFSLLLVVALYSFRFASIDIKNVNNTNPKLAIYYHQLRNAISSIYPYIDVDKREPNKRKSVHYFFEGKSDECFFTTSSGLFSRELVIVHLYYKEKKLWYEEGVIFKETINYKELKNILFTHKITILDNLDKFSFSYKLINQEFKVLKYTIPTLISINTIQGKKEKKYIFAIQSNNNQRLELVKEERAGF